MRIQEERQTNNEHNPTLYKLFTPFQTNRQLVCRESIPIVHLFSKTSFESVLLPSPLFGSIENPPFFRKQQTELFKQNLVDGLHFL